MRKMFLKKTNFQYQEMVGKKSWILSQKSVDPF